MRARRGEWNARPTVGFLLVVAAGLLAVAPAQAAGFVGSASCRVCHQSAYDQWRNSPHARALDSLTPQDRKDSRCLQCHARNVALGGKTDARCNLAWEAFLESLVKCVAAEMSIVSSPREILISGRLCRSTELSREVAHRLSSSAPVHRVAGFASVAKEAAQGAALIAEGLAGGTHERMVEIMGLRDAKGTSLDYLYVDGADALRRKYLRL